MAEPDTVEVPVRTRQCRRGRFTYLLGDLIVGRSLERYGEYAEFDVEQCQSLLRSGGIVV